MTVKSTWKRREREIAKRFNTERTPLSGINSKHTHSDTLSPNIFIELKYRDKFAVFKWYDKAAKYAKEEGKTPILALNQKYDSRTLVLIDINDMAEVVKYLNKEVKYLNKESDDNE